MIYTEFRCYCNHINAQNYSNYYSDYHFTHILIGPSGIALFFFLQLQQRTNIVNYDSRENHLTMRPQPFPQHLLQPCLGCLQTSLWLWVNPVLSESSYTTIPGIKTRVLGLLFKADCIKRPLAKVSARAPIPMQYWMALLIHIFTLLLLWTFPNTLLKPLKLFVFCTKGPKVYLGAHYNSVHLN